MKKQLKISYLDIILCGILINFLQLALFHELNAAIRYSFFGILLVVLTSNVKKVTIDINIAIGAIVLISCLLFINIFHYDSPSLLGVSLTIIPLFIFLFSNTVDISTDYNFYCKITAVHIVILLFSIYKYTFLMVGAEYILNENEVASYSFILVSLMYFLTDISTTKNKSYLICNTLVCIFIAFIMEARAIEFSIFVIPFVYIYINHKSRTHKFLFNLLKYITIIIPILMVIYIGKLVDFYADLIEQKFGLPAEAIKSELERFDMFSYIKGKLSKSFWGFGIGNTDYMKDIEIAGLHSGSLDLMYWGGYVLFVTFNLFFIVIINYTLKINPKLIFSCFVVLFYLLLQNYYEGLFFGNMGILLMILSMFTTLIIKAREYERFNYI